MDTLCTKCGRPLPPGQAFCENCGTAWTQAAASSGAANPMFAPTPAATQPAGGGSAGRIGVLLVALILIAALGIGGWLFLRHRASSQSSVAGITVSSKTAATSASNPSQSTPAAGIVAAVVPPAAVPVETPEAIAAATAAAASSKQCSLLTQAEMEQIVGAKIVKLTTDAITCSYFTDDTRSADVDTTWTGGKEAINAAKGFNSGPGLFEPVAGIGDEAYMSGAGVLHVLKGDTYIVVNTRVFQNDNENGHLEMEGAIARKALEKLQ